MLIEQTLEKMRAMKLHQMAKSLQERLSHPDHQDLSAQEILGFIVDDEFTARENARMESRLKGAKFKEKAACLENIDYKTNRGLKKQTMLELGQLKWINKKQNVAFTGPYSILGGPLESFAELGAYIACDPDASSYIPSETVLWFRQNILQ